MQAKRTRLRRIFLHFFDVHFLEEHGVAREDESTKEQVRKEADLATRFAILSADLVLLPAASFFESDICFQIIDNFQELFPSGQIRLVGSGSSIFEFLEDKLSQYAKNSPQYRSYASGLKHPKRHPPFLARKRSASRDITSGWLQVAHSNGIGKLLQIGGFRIPNNLEANWVKIPERLGNNAFILPYVQRFLFKQPYPSAVQNRIHRVINENYFSSFTRELHAGTITDLVFLHSDSIPSFDRDLPYRHARAAAARFGLLEKVARATPAQLAAIAGSSSWQKCLAQAFREQEEHLTSLLIMKTIPIKKDLDVATIGIITALPEEFAAVCEILDCGDPVDIPGQGAGRKYAVARVRTRAGAEHVVAVTFLTDMGNNSAAVRATLMKEHCHNVQHIMMVGIAGAVPNPKKPSEHVRLGDVVVSDRGGVVQYDMDKEMPAEIEHRHPPRPPAASLLEASKLLQAEELRGRRPWEPYINQGITRLGSEWERPPDTADILQDAPPPAQPIPHPKDQKRRPGFPRIFHGTIASANKLLKNPKKRDALRDNFKVKAVEMEASGVADATWNAEIGYFVIRGTCDYCNPDKGDDWHNYAALIAAAYAKCLLEVLSPPER